MENIQIKEVIKHNNEIYKILKKVRLTYFNNKNNQIIPELFNSCKEYFGADKVLKTQTHFLFCETVPDAEWEEIVNTEAQEPIGSGI